MKIGLLPNYLQLRPETYVRAVGFHSREGRGYDSGARALVTGLGVSVLTVQRGERVDIPSISLT